MSDLTHGDDRPAVLFLCVHNAGRSQMAAGFLRHLAAGRGEVFALVPVGKAVRGAEWKEAR